MAERIDSFVALDVETTGLDPSRHGIVELALVRFVAGVETASWQSLLQPGLEMHPDAVAIHGITVTDLAGAPRFAEVAAEVFDFIGAGPLLAYYARFDYGFLRAAVRPLERSIPPLKDWLDPLPLVRRRLGRGRARMAYACRHYGIPLEGAHRALADARAAGRLWLKLHEG